MYEIKTEGLYEDFSKDKYAITVIIKKQRVQKIQILLQQ